MSRMILKRRGKKKGGGGGHIPQGAVIRAQYYKLHIAGVALALWCDIENVTGEWAGRSDIGFRR